MAQSELNVTNRDRTGKGVARTLRREGLIPATVYGRGLEPCSIIVEPKALKAAIATEAGWNTLITLKGDGAFSGKVVILKDLQVDAIRRNMKHADFQVINMKKKVHVMVPVHTIGKSAGEKVGGNLQVIRHELEVVCLPTVIPSAIEVDVTDMEIGDVVHIADRSAS
jgi:large subunit ribosomal protein L25